MYLMKPTKRIANIPKYLFAEIDRKKSEAIKKGVDIIDLNVGCPAKNVISSCCGSALMAHPDQLEKILKAFRSSLTIPFTVKIRAGNFSRKRKSPGAYRDAAHGVVARGPRDSGWPRRRRAGGRRDRRCPR